MSQKKVAARPDSIATKLDRQQFCSNARTTKIRTITRATMALKARQRSKQAEAGHADS